jgi:non-ribosomal peptide synthetase component F/acyl carrier protein
MPEPVEKRSFPLSALQSGLWFAYEADRSSPTYHVTFAAKVAAPVDGPTLKKAWAATCMRHEQLRATFHGSAAGVTQRIEPKCTAELAEIDASSWTDDRLGTSVADRHRRPFDLARSSARAFFYRTKTGGVLLVTVHMIVADARAMELVLNDFGRFYEGEAQNAPVTLAPPAARYETFAAATRDATVDDTEGAFWATYLAGTDPLDLVLDRERRPTPKTMRGTSASFVLDAETTTALRALRPNLLRHLLAGYQIALRAFRRQPTATWSPTIAVMADVRDAAQADVVGSFVNNLPVRLDLDTACTFREAVARVEERMREVVPHKGTAFPAVVRKLRVRSGELPPIAQASLTFFGARGRVRPDLLPALVHGAAWTSKLGPLQVEAFPLVQRDGLFPLQLRVVELADGTVAGELQGDNDFFQAKTVEAIRDRLVAVLRDGARKPDAPVGELAPMPEASRATAATFGEAAPALSQGRTPALVLAAASSAPGAPALARADGTSMTAAQMQERSGAVAAWLRQRGLGPDDCVAVTCTDPALLVCACLGALRAGVPWTVVDPTWPASLATAARSGAAVDLDDAAVSSATGSAEDVAVAPSAIACHVLVAAGPQPARVAIPAAALDAQVAAVRTALALTPTDGVLALPWRGEGVEVLAALASGARVVLPSREVARDASALAEACTKTGATVLAIPSSTWRMLLRSDAKLRKGTRGVWLGVPSDELRDALAEQGVALTVAFTTSGGWVTFGALGAADLRASGALLPGARARVVDAAGAPVAAYVPGALQVAVPGEPTLRDSGAIARWLEGGVLDVVGRSDGTFEAGGLRVATSDVEAAVRALPGVGDAALVAREDAPGGTGHALFVASTERTEDDVRAALEALFPKEAVPAAIVVSETLPTVASGALDRGALAFASMRKSSGTEAAHGSLEDQLAGIWREVLRVEHVGPSDDFFDLGGHSLLATKIAALVRDRLGVEVPLRTFFDAPTVAELADKFRKQHPSLAEAGAKPGSPPPQRGQAEPAGPGPIGRARSTVPSFAQDAITAWEAARAPSATWTAGLTLRLGGALDEGALEAAIAALLERHDSLRATFQGRKLGVCRPDDVRLEHLSFANEGDLAAFRVRASNAPFALDGKPLVRFQLARRDPTDHELVVTWHQLVHDPTAFLLFADELLELYAARVEKRASKLAPLPIRYADYAAWERSWFDGDGRVQIEAARRILMGAKPLDLAEKARPAKVDVAAVESSFDVDAAAATRFEGACKAASCTVFMGFAASVALLLARWSGVDDVPFLSPVNLRGRRTETEKLMGRFLNWMPIRISVAGDPTFRELIGRARAAVLAAQEVDWAPASRVYEAEDPYSHPLGRVLLNTPFVGTALERKSTCAGLSVTTRNLEGASGARNDLAFVLRTPGGAMQGSLRGAAELFHAKTIEARADELRRIVSNADPDKLCSQL